ncbi:ABC transporter substrate-binding protein [Vibrio navarrensis]|nr:ABC transporter substrate-binding protein [Vibrio navarrensis]
MNEANIRRLNQLLNRYERYHCYQVILDELEHVLSTSRRNVSIILKNLSDLGWIEWRPSVGRSKASQLIIRNSLSDALLQVLKEELKQGRFQLITRLLELYGVTTVNALALATEEQNDWNEANSELLITHYPWVDSVDPQHTVRHAELHIVRSIYDTLLKQNVEGKLKPSIAHAWQMEGKTLTLWLRPDIQRHDGKRLTASDVVWSLTRLLDDGPVAHLFEQVESITALSLSQIQVVLKRANTLFPYILAMPHASIVCPDIIQFDAKHRYYLGTGPFRLHDWNEEHLVLKRHEHYFAESALLRQITLSHADDTLTHEMSFNRPEGKTETTMLSAFSYLTYNQRAQAGITQEDWHKLFAYLQHLKGQYAPKRAVSGLCSQSEMALISSLSTPQLRGTLVLAEPKWTLPYLQATADWLHQAIRATGLTLQVLDLTEISHPESVRAEADLLLIEEVIESPLEYRVYEWLLITSGLRFIFIEHEWLMHHEKIAAAVAADNPVEGLADIEQALYQHKRILPLFAGKEAITKARQVKGIQVKKTGYSDFYQLWIGDPRVVN